MNLLSKHAHKRASQRGINIAQIDAVLNYADRVAHRGGGTQYIWISRPMIRRLGPKTPEGIDTDRLRNVHILIASDGTVVTVLRTCKRHCRTPI